MNTDEGPAERIFNEAVNLPPERQSAFLDAACGDNAELRNEVEELLWAKDQEQAVGFMKGPTSTVPLASSPAAEKPGDKLGRYRIIEKIGEGGMGVVYLAEQEGPIPLKVALKIIKLGMDTKRVVARFEAERQNLAMMDHPYIATVFDAGETESGRPYFVMPFVKGVRIDKYCDEQKLAVRQRLELFIKVSEAIEHAHQKGIIHRDIKPSNILVSSVDGRPEPKVIDFGIAKATSEPVSDRTPVNYVIGTPNYMSPEQLEGSPNIDTRSDIYSLGVLLYELLIGVVPFLFDEKKMTFTIFRSNVLKELPIHPSVRIFQEEEEDQKGCAVLRKLDHRN